MNIVQLKKFETSLGMMYPLLRQPGVTTPAKYGRVILTRDQLVNLFYDKAEADYTLDVARWIASGLSAEVLKDKRFKDEDRSDIVNQHLNVAETLLLHHSKRFPDLYKNNIEEFEEVRGEYLYQVAMQEDASVVSWTAYGYWLSAHSEKFTETNPVKADDFKKDAEVVFRQAHNAGYAVATEALATFLYVANAQREEPIKLWEQAAAAGNATAIQNLSNILMADDSFTHEEKNHSLMAVWEGIAVNKKDTRDIAKSLKQSGFIAILPADDMPSPA